MSKTYKFCKDGSVSNYLLLSNEFFTKLSSKKLYLFVKELKGSKTLFYTIGEFIIIFLGDWFGTD